MDLILYRLPGLVNEYLEFSGVNGFISAIFVKTIYCVGKPIDSHLNSVFIYLKLCNQYYRYNPVDYLTQAIYSDRLMLLQTYAYARVESIKCT